MHVQDLAVVHNVEHMQPGSRLSLSHSGKGQRKEYREDIETIQNALVEKPFNNDIVEYQQRLTRNLHLTCAREN